MSTKFAIYLPNYGVLGDARVLADLAKDAEDARWDGFFLWDHVATDPPQDVVDPWVALAAVAMNTQTIQLATTVTPIPRRRPWKLAREVVSIDHLSNGRFTLGVGIGLGDAEWGNLGEETDQRVRAAMLDETLEVLTGLWTGEPFSYDGAYYTINEAHFLPKPINHIPIWVGGFWPNKAPMRRMARWDGMMPIVPSEGPERVDEYQQAYDFVQAERQQLGIDGPFDMVCMGITPGDDKTAAKARVAAYANATWWAELLLPEIYGSLEGLRKRVAQGPPK